MHGTLWEREVTFAWVIEDIEGAGYAKQDADGSWTWVQLSLIATHFDNEPEAILTGHAMFPTLRTRVVKVRVK